VFLSPPWGVLNKKKVKPALQRMGEALSGNIPERERRTHMHLSHEGVLWTNASSDMVPTTTLPKANQANGDIRDPDLNYQLSNIAETYIYTEYSVKNLLPLEGFALAQLCVRYLRTPNLALYLPPQPDPGEVAELGHMIQEESGRQFDELCYYEESKQYIKRDLAATICYYGELANEKFSSTTVKPARGNIAMSLSDKAIARMYSMEG